MLQLIWGWHYLFSAVDECKFNLRLVCHSSSIVLIFGYFECSPSPPSLVDVFPACLLDALSVDHLLAFFLSRKSEFCGLPSFLFGQSMGGAVALKMHLKQPSSWDGAVLLAPMCKVFTCQDIDTGEHVYEFGIRWNIVIIVVCRLQMICTLHLYWPNFWLH